MKKLTYILPLFIFALLTGCVSTTGVIDDQQAAAIPDGASTVILTLSEDPDSTFTDVRRRLIRDGHRIEYDQELKTITTEGIDIGESTFARYTLYIEDNQIVGRADWTVGMEAQAMASAMSGLNMNMNWEPALWDSGRPKRAFASLVTFLNQVPHHSKEYK